MRRNARSSEFTNHLCAIRKKEDTNLHAPPFGQLGHVFGIDMTQIRCSKFTELTCKFARNSSEGRVSLHLMKLSIISKSNNKTYVETAHGLAESLEEAIVFVHDLDVQFLFRDARVIVCCDILFVFFLVTDAARASMAQTQRVAATTVRTLTTTRGISVSLGTFSERVTTAGSSTPWECLPTKSTLGH